MRPIAFLGLFLLLTGCVPPVSDAMRRTAVAPEPAVASAPPPSPSPTQSSLTQPAAGWGGTLPSVPSGGLGAEAPMAKPKASKMPTIAPPVSAADQPTGASTQSIVVPNGNGTSTIIHPDGTTETIATPK